MLESAPAGPDEAIDVVILWVDGKDPVLKEKRDKYIREENLTQQHTSALPTRFSSSGEIRYCVLSILSFAPFVRKIFIVTDGQDPDLDADLDKYFPGRKDDLQIIDHKEIFRGYEANLPSFNPTSISSLIWRIPGLAEKFIYFNDDVFLLRPTSRDDWFIGNRPVLRGKWLRPPYRKIWGHTLKTFFKRSIMGNGNYQPRISFYIRQWKAAKLLGMGQRYYFHDHTPHPMSRKLLEEFFRERSDILEFNIKARFRDPEQFLITALAYHLEIGRGDSEMAQLNSGYLHPIYSERRLHRKIDQCQENPEIKSMCVQSLDMLDRGIEGRVFGWMDKILGIESDKT